MSNSTSKFGKRVSRSMQRKIKAGTAGPGSNRVTFDRVNPSYRFSSPEGGRVQPGEQMRDSWTGGMLDPDPDLKLQPHRADEPPEVAQLRHAKVGADVETARSAKGVSVVFRKTRADHVKIHDIRKDGISLKDRPDWPRIRAEMLAAAAKFLNADGTRKTVKREPLLCDKYIALPREGNWISARDHDTTCDNLRLAKRFVLHADAARYCAQMIREAPEVIAHAQEFALQPFDRMYIELPFAPWFKTITGRDQDADADTRIGYLYVNGIVRSLAESPGEGAALYPVEYQLWNPFTPDERRDAIKKMGLGNSGMDVFFWGDSALKFVHDAGLVERADAGWITNHTFDIDEGFKLDDKTKALLRSLSDNHRFRLMLASDAEHLGRSDRSEQEQLQILARSSAGDMRNIVALLLFLNRTKQYQYEAEEPTVTRMWRTKPIPFLKHRVITIHVNPMPRLIKLSEGRIGTRHRRHDVRGHFCLNLTARTNGHVHEWQESEHANERRWFCACGGLRWWRREHKRGYEDKGIVTSAYAVRE